jgi:hypothetical protein
VPRSRGRRAIAAALLALAAACSGAQETEPAPASIGTATLQQDGTLILDLRTDARDGARGEARLVYAPSHPQHAEILRHLGGLSPGQSKPVAPWP